MTWKHCVEIISLCSCCALSDLSPSESPGSPSSLRVSNVTNTSVVLSWSPPVNGGGRPLSEIFYTITAIGELVLFISK